MAPGLHFTKSPTGNKLAGSSLSTDLIQREKEMVAQAQ
jgi:hypothetical protein